MHFLPLLHLLIITILATVVQVEAHPNSADEYCVAASVLNRVLSDKFPDTVSGVVFAPGQYEGIYTLKDI